MTQGKLKMYRRDRLYASDKDRLENLQNCLKNVRVLDEASFFNSQNAESSPSKGAARARDGVPPKSNNVIGRGGGGPTGGGAGGGAAGGGGGNFSTSGAKTGGDKTSGGGNKGNSEYSSQARQHGSANNNKYSTNNPGLNNATITAESQKVITNINSLT